MIDNGSAESFGLGKSVSIDGDYVCIGAWSEASNGRESGAVYIFKRSGTTWIQEARLTASDGAEFDYFGYSVSISGNHVLIGAYGDDGYGDRSGSTYIFKRNGNSWSQQQKIVSPDANLNDFIGEEFGVSVSLDDDYALIGAPGQYTSGIKAGAAYVFKLSETTWSLQTKLTALNPNSSDGFGISVDLFDDYALIGASGDTDKGLGAGAAYVFKRRVSWWTQTAKLIAPDGSANDGFGSSVSLDGDYALIAADLNDDMGNNSGSAYVFKRNGSVWNHQQKLVALDGAPDDWFGYSVSINSDFALIGAVNDEDTTGSAYIFYCNDDVWTQQEKLIATDGVSGDYFGTSVCLDGYYAFIGTPGDDDMGSYSGSTYIFKRNDSSWNQEDKIVVQDGNAEEWFGYSVSIDEDYALVGAIGDDDMGEDSGAAYIFKCSVGICDEEYKLTALDGAAGAGFGLSVSIDGVYALVGAYRDDDMGKDSGAAYVFKRSGTSWNQQAKLTAQDGEPYDTFGYSVSLSGDYALIGAPGDDDMGDWAGSAYIFKRSGTTWAQEEKIIPVVCEAGDCFGYAVCLDGEYALIGAYGDDGCGSAYVFKRNENSWAQQAKLIASDGELHDHFGVAVSIDEDRALIGAPGDDDMGHYTGSAYVFKRSEASWYQEEKIVASDSEKCAFFGCAVSISKNHALIGSEGDYSGSAYVFRFSEDSWILEEKLFASDCAAGDWFGHSVSLNSGCALIGSYQDDDYGSGSGSAYVFTKLNPKLQCSGSLSWSDVSPGYTVTSSFQVENVGDSDSELCWAIDTYPAWGTWTFKPKDGSGLTPEMEPVSVTVNVVAPDEKDEEFSGEIKVVNSENTSDFDTIQVSLTTPINKATDRHFFVLYLLKQFLKHRPLLCVFSDQFYFSSDFE